MKKYYLYSEKGIEIIRFFIHKDGQPDHTMINRINNITNIRATNKKKQKHMLVITNDDVSALAIIDKPRKTCYIYSNCGLNFDVTGFFDDLFEYQRYIAAISCDELIYSRLRQYVDINDIFFKKELVYYSIEINSLLTLDCIDITTDFKNDNKVVINDDVLAFLMYNHFYKILDDNRILFIYENLVGTITVDDTNEFTNKYFKIVKENHTIDINDTDKLTGIHIQYLEKHEFFEIEKNINSFTMLRVNNNDYKIISSLKKHPYISLLSDIKIIIKTFNYEDLKTIYFTDSNEIDSTYFSLKDITDTSNQIYLYLFNSASHLVKEIPELRRKVSYRWNGYAYFIVYISIHLYFYIPLLYNSLILPAVAPTEHIFTFKVLFHLFWLILVGLPFAMFRPKRVYYDNVLVKKYYFSFDFYSKLLFSFGVIILFCFIFLE